jgi:hypothetical protein
MKFITGFGHLFKFDSRTFGLILPLPDLNFGHSPNSEIRIQSSALELGDPLELSNLSSLSRLLLPPQV